MRPRLLTAAALVAIAALGLTSCDSKIGTAATVNGQRISDNEVTSYISQAGADPSAVAQAQGPVQPRSSALTQLIQEKIFEETLRGHGGVPTDSQLAAVHDKAISAIAQSSLTGADYDRAVAQQVKKFGFSSRFGKLVVRTLELEYTLATRLKSPSQLLPAIKKAGISVTVSGRYGKWDPSRLNVDTSGSNGLPSFVQLEPSAKAGAGPAASQ